MPIDYAKYPANWRELRATVLARAGDRCEGSPAYPDCRAANHQPHPVTGSRVVLTIAHLFDDDHATQDLTRLRAWCQRCHLCYDLHKHMARARATRDRKRGQLELACESM